MKFPCPRCSAILGAASEQQGMEADCGYCSAEFTVPHLAGPTILMGVDPDELLAQGLESVAPPSTDDWIPPTLEELQRLVPQYAVESMIGRGGMGAVYKGSQSRLDRKVAIKLLPAELAENPDFVARFEREARTLAKLDHPGIIRVYDFGQTSENHLFFVMEFVEGADLHRLIRGSGLNPKQALEIIGQVCDALQFAHSQGVVHRDIKPANILVTTGGRVKLADFGLARPMQAGASGRLTLTRVAMGTPDYMAPEQKRGEGDHRVDLYALGVMLYEMLCGRTPQGAWQPPSQRVRVDARLDQVVIKAMQEEPERRYQQASEVRTDVEIIRASMTMPTGQSVADRSENTAPEMPSVPPAKATAPGAAHASAKTSPKIPPVLAAACLLLALGIGGWWGMHERKGIPTSGNGNDPGSAMASAPEKPKLTWIESKLPAADADGWITIFDGKKLYGATVSEPDLASKSVRLENDTLVVDNCSVSVPLAHTDVAMRFTGKIVDSRNMSLMFRINREPFQAYHGWFNRGRNPKVGFGISNPNYNDLVVFNSDTDFWSFSEGEIEMIGNRLNQRVGGRTIGSFTDDQIESGEQIGFGAATGVVRFKRIEVKLLKPTSTVTSENRSAFPAE